MNYSPIINNCAEFCMLAEWKETYHSYFGVFHQCVTEKIDGMCFYFIFYYIFQIN